VTRSWLNPERKTRMSQYSTSRRGGENTVQETSSIMTRLRDATSLPDILTAAFDAFETTRQLARDCEDHAPALFAAFMTTADAAVEGREAISIAPGLARPGRARDPVTGPEPSAPVEEVAAALTALSALLRDRLWHAATIATAASDQTACTDAAQAADRMCQLMSSGDDDSRPG
jgi:hypothetical protein